MDDAANNAIVGRPFEAGKSGNPLGRPRMDKVAKEMLKAATPKAVQRLAEALDAVRGKDDDGNGIPDHDVRMRAANAILDRLYGKPHQSISGEDGGPIKLDIDLLGTLQRLVGGGR